MPRAELGDLELHFEERGSGLALLLIACIPAIANDWASLAEPLSASRRVVAYDNRGSGASTVTPGPYTTAQLHRRIPRSRLEVVAGAGHLFFLEAPERSLTALSRFLHN